MNRDERVLRDIISYLEPAVSDDTVSHRPARKDEPLAAELAAMKKCWRVLTPFDICTQQRVIDWLKAKLIDEANDRAQGQDV